MLFLYGLLWFKVGGDGVELGMLFWSEIIGLLFVVVYGYVIC